jgi:hypothetical protein
MICPACMASAATFAVGVTSSGGMVALVVARFHRVIRFRTPGLDSKAVDPKIKEKQS